MSLGPSGVGHARHPRVAGRGCNLDRRDCVRSGDAEKAIKIHPAELFLVLIHVSALDSARTLLDVRAALQAAFRCHQRTLLPLSVRDLFLLGPFPSEDAIDQEDIKERERLLHQITAPVSDEEARLLSKCFGVNDCYGLAWMLLHLVESAPNFRIDTEPPADASEWIRRLWRRHRNGLDQ